MQAVLQSLADTCGEQLSEAPAHTTQQGSFPADAALAAHAESSASGCGSHSAPASPSQITSGASASGRAAQQQSPPRGCQDRRAASDCRLKAGVHSTARRTRRAAQLTRLKVTLRSARLPRAALGAAPAGAAQDTTSTQSAIEADAPASSRERNSSTAVVHSSGPPESRMDQKECGSEASEGLWRRAQQQSNALPMSTSLSWRTQQSEGSQGFTEDSFSATGSAEHLLEATPPGMRTLPSLSPAVSMKRLKERPAAGAWQSGATGQDNIDSSSRPLAMRELKAPELRVRGIKSVPPLQDQESSYAVAGKLQDTSTERRHGRRPKHIVQEASSGMAPEKHKCQSAGCIIPGTAARIRSSMSWCRAAADGCLVLHAGRAGHRHAHAVRRSMGRTERDYRRQKALAAELRAKEPVQEQAPPRCIPCLHAAQRQHKLHSVPPFTAPLAVVTTRMAAF